MGREHLITNCIIIKRINYKDADRIITIYSESLGKTAIIAKGIRKLSSKKKGHLELFSNSKVNLVKSYNWYIVTQAKTINSHDLLKNDPRRLYQGYYCLEIFDKLIPEHESNKILYDLLLKTIQYLNDTDSEDIILAFNIKLLKILGYYSINQDKSLGDHIKYAKFLIENTYEVISNSNQYDNSQRKSLYNYFRSYTESVLEKELKTEITWE